MSEDAQATTDEKTTDTTTSANEGAEKTVDDAAKADDQKASPEGGSQKDAKPADANAKDATKDAKQEDKPWDGSGLTAPDGWEPDQVDSEMLEGFGAAAAKMPGLTQEGAQAVVQWFGDQRKAEAEAATVARDELFGEWDKELKADGEFGGDNFDRSVADAALFIQKYGDDGVQQFLEETGGIRHPGIAKMLARAGKVLRDDSGAKGIKDAPRKRKSLGDAIYDHPTSQMNGAG